MSALIKRSIVPIIAAFTKPIPKIDGAGNAGSYHNVAFDLTHPRAREPLVKLSDYGIAGESFYDRTDGKNAPYNEKIVGATKRVWARLSVALYLQKVNEILRPFGVEVFVWDAYRPVECQKGLWKFFAKQATQQFPTATPEEIRNWILNYVSDPTAFDKNKPETWPIHTSGGAVDLTLRDIKTGNLLGMGAGFDEMGAIAHSDYFEYLLQNGEISDNYLPLLNRRLLYWGMTQAGFTNYPFEFWHYDLWNQMYVMNAALQGRPNPPKVAHYGYIESPEA